MSNHEDIVAVTDTVPTAGAIVWWRLSGDIDHSSLANAWLAAGERDDTLLETPSPASALRRAVNTLRETHVLVRALGQGEGFAVVRETIKDRVTADVDYDVKFRVFVDPVGRLKFGSGVSQLDMDVVRAQYDHFLETLTPQDVSSWLVDIMVSLDAVALRDTGGVYFVPPTSLDRLNRITDALKSVSAHAVHKVRALRTEDAVAGILDALELEANTEYNSISSDLSSGKLGSRGLTTRAEQCEAVESKLTRYEELLDVTLDRQRQLLEGLRANITVAILSAQSAEERERA